MKKNITLLCADTFLLLLPFSVDCKKSVACLDSTDIEEKYRSWDLGHLSLDYQTL